MNSKPWTCRTVFRRLGRMAGIVLLVVGSPTAMWAQGQGVGDEPPGSEVSQWVADLDAKDYETRHQATEKLIAAGGLSVIESLRSAVHQGASAETQIRAFHILAAVAVNGGEGDEQAAHEAIEAIASSADGGMARRALMILEQVRRIYENPR